MDDLGETRFSVGERRRTEMENRLKKVRPDLTEEERDALFDYLGTLTKPNGDNDTKLQNATFNWFARGAIRIPEDMDKVRQAVKVAERFGADTSKYYNPMELIDTFSERTGTDNPIDPDTVPTLSNKVDYGNGITVYDVDESEESRQWMRKIIDTHLGKNRNPWCLLATDKDGNLYKESSGLWHDTYNKYPKRVAFRDGRLVAFFASSGEPTWWDAQDKPYGGIPVTRKMDDGSGRTATYEYNEGTGEMSEPHDIHKGNKKNGTYEEWHDNGQRRSRETYKNGYLVGTAEKWYANGNLQERQTYKNGVLDGYFARWQRDGTIELVTQYKEGNKNGIFVQFDNKGNVNYYEEEKNNIAAGLTIAEDSYNTNGSFIAWEKDSNGHTVRDFPREEAERLYAEKTAEVNAMLAEQGIPTKVSETKFSAEERNEGESVGNEEKSVNLQGESGSGPKYRGWEKRSTEINTSDYEPTDEFRGLQEESRSRGEGASVEAQSTESLDESDNRQRLAGILRRQLDSSGSAAGESDELYLRDNPNAQVGIRKNVSGKLFHDIMEVVKPHLQFGELVDLHDNYDDCICYLSEDGISGFAINKGTGYFTSVFNLDPRKPFIKELKNYLHGQGATYGDCFASSTRPLHRLYERVLGVKAVATVDFNTEYDSSNISAAHDNPKIVFFYYPEGGSDTTTEMRHFDKDGYDEAARYTRSLISENSADFRASAEERELSDADTRETVSDIENPEGDTRFSATERVAATVTNFLPNS